LLTVAATAELVVVGHRHRAFGRLGSVASAVLHRADCPVLVIPLTERPEVGWASASAPGRARTGV
jgi:nucleotide-binding universal stress UspA family protein